MTVAAVGIDNWFSLAIAIGLIVYLLVTLLMPEKF